MMHENNLSRLDSERQVAGQPSACGNVIREYSLDGSECRIVYSRCKPEALDACIEREVSLAKSRGYTLEWKVYHHDAPANLGERLRAAGFACEPLETVMVLSVTEALLAGFDTPDCEIRRVHDSSGLNDVAEIARQIGRANADEEQLRLSLDLRSAPDGLSIYVAYIDDEPVSSGRIHFSGGTCAELAGGRTKTTHRKRGLFTAIVGQRLREAHARKCTHVYVDALPASEPALRRMGFEQVTHTQPFVFEPTET